MQQGISLKTRSYKVRFTGVLYTQAGYAFHVLYKAHKQEAKNFLQTTKKDFGVACHTPPLNKINKQGEMPLPSLGPIPSLNSTFF